jgi:hypothetical protein
LGLHDSVGLPFGCGIAVLRSSQCKRAESRISSKIFSPVVFSALVASLRFKGARILVAAPLLQVSAVHLRSLRRRLKKTTTGKVASTAKTAQSTGLDSRLAGPLEAEPARLACLTATANSGNCFTSASPSHWASLT